jgi:hypothetical protein
MRGIIKIENTIPMITRTKKEEKEEKKEKPTDDALSKCLSLYEQLTGIGRENVSSEGKGRVADHVWEDLGHYFIDSCAYQALKDMCEASEDARRIFSAELQDMCHPHRDTVLYDDLKSATFRSRGKALMSHFRDRVPFVGVGEEGGLEIAERAVWFLDDGFCVGSLHKSVERALVEEVGHRGRVLSVSYDDLVRDRRVLRSGSAGVIVTNVIVPSHDDVWFTKKLVKVITDDKKNHPCDSDTSEVSTVYVLISRTEDVREVTERFLDKHVKHTYHVSTSGTFEARDRDGVVSYLTENTGVHVKLFTILERLGKQIMKSLKGRDDASAGSGESDESKGFFIFLQSILPYLRNDVHCGKIFGDLVGKMDCNHVFFNALRNM